MANSDQSMWDGGASSLHNKLQVKNKTPAPIQITAEQLLREAVDRQADEPKAPIQRIADSEELQQYRVRKRKEFEDILRRQAHHIGTWIKYAEWEAAQNEFRRARSIFERSLNIDYQNVGVWTKYIEMETRNKFINSARNLYDRVCQLLPRVDQFWFKYAHMEELLGSYAGARAVYERWMEWNPPDNGWMVYIRFEERCNEIERARAIFERYLSNRPSQESFLRFCKFEERLRNIQRARAGFEKAIQLLPPGMLTEEFYTKFADFEIRMKQNDRAKAILTTALKQIPKDKAEALYHKYVVFQKQHGQRQELEDTILSKRRFIYKQELNETPNDYDIWFDLIRLEETGDDVDRIRETYEQAVANKPLVLQKPYWKRYIYLWINYAIMEELKARDIERCREVYLKALKIVPVKHFTFAKLYILYAEFELRQLNLDKCRLAYGRGIGECGKPKIYESYANLELRLGNISRCRHVFAKYIENNQTNPKSWVALTELELLAEEIDRAVGVCEIAIGMDQMDNPELLWKTYIDLEINHGTPERVRALYERLLAKTQHFKVFQGYADYEFKNLDNIEKARAVILRGLEICKNRNVPEHRAQLLEFWISIERENGDEEKIAEVFKKLPRKVKRRRQVLDQDGQSQGYEECMTYVFPEDGLLSSNVKILEAAKAWKKKKLESQKVEKEPE